MENILYLDDNINLYNKKIDKTIIMKPYKKTLKNGKIIDREKFLKKFVKIKKNNYLNNYFIGECIIVIINSNYSKEDKYNLKEILEELNYKNVKFIKEKELIKIDNKTVFINYNFSYLNIYYIDSIGNIEMKMYEKDYIIDKIIIKILNIINKRKIIITGKNYKELIPKLEKTNFEYFFYENNDNLYIDLLNSKNV